MIKHLRTIIAVFFLFFIATTVHAQTIPSISPWYVNAANQITQRVANTVIEITGLSDGCLGLSSHILVSSGSACGTGGGGSGLASSSLQAIYPIQINNGTSAITFSSALGTTTSNTWAGTQTFTNTISGNINGNSATVTNGVYTTTFNNLFDNRLSATTTLPNITTLAGLSLPYSQITGVPSFLTDITGLVTAGTNVTITGSGTSGSPYVINASGGGSSFAYPFPLTGNATSTLTQFNGGLTAYASSTIGNGGANGLTINGNATTTGLNVTGSASITGGLTLGTPLPIASGGTNAASFATVNNGVYWNGTSLATAPLTSAVTTPYASSTSFSTTGGVVIGTGGGSLQVNGNTAFGGTTISPNYILTIASQVTDPATFYSAINGAKTVALTASNAQQIYGISGQVSMAASAFNDTGVIAAGGFTAADSNTATVNTESAELGVLYMEGTGILTNGYGQQINIQNLNGAGTITNAYGLYVGGGFNNGTISHEYGSYVDTLPAASSTYGYYENSAANNFFKGDVLLGNTTNSTQAQLLVGTTTANYTGQTLLNVANSSNTGLFTVLGNGNVGIGTSSPYQNLSVAGNEVVTGNVFWPSLGTPAGSFLAVNQFGQVIATTSPSGGGTTYTAAYPVTLTGSAFGLAFGTTTANSWSALQNFTNATSTLLSAGTIWDTGLGAGFVQSSATGLLSSAALTSGQVTTALGFIPFGGTNPLPIANGGTNATSFTTTGNGVYWNGTSLLTAPLTSAVVTPYASSTVLSVTNSAYFATSGGFVGIGTSTPTNLLSLAPGSVSVPAISFGDTATGLFRSAINAIGFAINGVENMTLNSTGLGLASTSPAYRLSVGTVGNAYGSIVSVENKLSTSTSMTVDWSQGNQQLIQTGTSATSIVFSKVISGATLRLVVCNPNTSAGALTFTGVEWSGGTTPTQTTTANQCDIWSFIATEATSTSASAFKIFGAQSSAYP